MTDEGFTALVAAYRSELRVHCYRMLGRFDDAEDLVQETYLRAWRGRDSLRDPATARAWLYRIATNACLDFLRRHRRVAGTGRDDDASPLGGPRAAGAGSPASVPWLQPYPDSFLPPSAHAISPEDRLVGRETLRIAFVAAVQHLPPRQRAVLLLRDVVAVSAAECAAMLEISVPAANSVLQRARATMRRHLPQARDDWATAGDLTAAERCVVERYVRATENGDLDELARLVAAEATFTMPPDATAIDGSAAIVEQWARAMAGSGPGHWKHVVTGANRQPAVAAYWRGPGQDRYSAVGLDVLVVRDEQVHDITTFPPSTFVAFDLPLTLS